MTADKAEDAGDATVRGAKKVGDKTEDVGKPPWDKKQAPVRRNGRERRHHERR